MPTWQIEYPSPRPGARSRYSEDINLIRNDPSCASVEVTESTDRPIIVVKASFLGVGPSDPRVREIVRCGSLQIPVNIWFPLQVSRLFPENGSDVVRGRTQHAAILDDAAHFRPGTPVGIDPATGLIVPNSNNPIGLITEETSLLEEPPPRLIIGVDPGSGLDRTGVTVSRYPVRTEMTVIPGDPPGSLESIGFTVHEEVGMAVYNPAAVQRLVARRVEFPEFELQDNPSINIGEIRNRRFNIIDRAAESSRQSIQAAEDQRIFEALDAMTDQPFTDRPIRGLPPQPPLEPVYDGPRPIRFTRILEDEWYPL